MGIYLVLSPAVKARTFRALGQVRSSACQSPFLLLSKSIPAPTKERSFMWTTRIPPVAKWILPMAKIFPHVDSLGCWRQYSPEMTHKHYHIDARIIL